MRALAIPLLLALGACGGGGGNETQENPRRSAEGLWIGATATGRTLTGLILSDGKAWLFYSEPNNSARLAGVVQAPGTSNKGSFASGSARNLDVQDNSVRSATLSASYTAKTSFSGSITFSFVDVISFTTTYGLAYDSIPDLANLAGRHTGRAALPGRFADIDFSVDGSGAITGVTPCNFSGLFTPRSHANVFDAAMTFSDPSCAGAGFAEALEGIAFFDGGKLFIGVLDGNRESGFAIAIDGTASASANRQGENAAIP
jgi:hypothetical protein